MSLAGLVEYDSSDESDNDTTKEIPSLVPTKDRKINNQATVEAVTDATSNIVLQPNFPKSDSINIEDGLETDIGYVNNTSNNLCLNTLPKPKTAKIINEVIENDVPKPIIKSFVIDKPTKKERGPVKISIPSLSDVSKICHLIKLFTINNIYVLIITCIICISV